MMENVKLAGYDIPTPIQQYCMPAVKLGYDVVACAQTGNKITASLSPGSILVLLTCEL
jgi:ATP-dependent RNA helicase DDX3X